MQLLLPGERAPAHRHTPSAARLVVEGDGAYTIVDGQKCIMKAGDLILTPGGMWHDHGHDGTEPVIWLDALDLPLFVYLEGSYAVEGELQAPANRPDSSAIAYSQAGLVPRRRGDAVRPRYPQLRFPWERTEAALRNFAAYSDPATPVELDYVNPETGDACLPTLGFAAMMLRPSEIIRPPRRSTSHVFHVIGGAGQSSINGETIEWKRGDTFSAPVFAKISHQAGGKEPGFLLQIHDGPLQEKLCFYEERAAQ
jgi:gentisate 1,2-dioxygenase